MNRRGFLGSLFAGIACAVVAPKLLTTTNDPCNVPCVEVDYGVGREVWDEYNRKIYVRTLATEHYNEAFITAMDDAQEYFEDKNYPGWVSVADARPMRFVLKKERD